VYDLSSLCGVYLQKPLNHMPNVVRIITERASELAALDKVVYYFSPKVSLILYSSTEQPTAHRTHVCGPQLFSNTLNPYSHISRTIVWSGLVHFVCIVKFSEKCWRSNGIHAYGMGTSYMETLTFDGMKREKSKVVNSKTSLFFQ